MAKQLKKADREKIIRSRPMHCRGPRDVGRDPVLALLKQNAEASGEDSVAALALEYVEEKKSLDAAISAALEDGGPALAAASMIDALGRRGCGADFTDIIVAGPHDGAVHEYECPQCGLTGKYIAPAFPADDEDVQAMLHEAEAAAAED